MKKRAKKKPKAADLQFRKRRRRRKAAKSEVERVAGVRAEQSKTKQDKEP
jgi:hypothetical protein